MSGATTGAGVDHDVVVVGGGPVGLAMSIELSLHGVDHALFERHESTTYHPKARNLNLRTMEIVRRWGVGDDMDAVALGEEWCSTITYCRDLVAPELGRMSTGGFVGVGDDISPVVPHLSSQDVYEPIWRDRAEELAGPGRIRFGHSVVAVADRGDHVEVSLDDSSSLTARYVVGCDGWNSGVRRGLGVELEGRTDLARFVNVYFRTDLLPLVGHRPSVLFFTTEPRGVLQPLDGQYRWLCQITHLGDEDPLELYDEAACLNWIRSAAGDPNLDVEIRSIGTWTMNATVADRYRVGRVLLAGDSVHQLPPTGGFGANTGIQDAHNLAWKLSMVLRGQAGDGLLDTYEAERRPVARYNADRSLENSRMVGRITAAALRGDDAALEVGRSTRYGNFTGMELGFSYESAAVVESRGSPDPDDTSDAGDTDPAIDPVIDYVPRVWPGHRLPHVWLDEARSVSTLDLPQELDGLVLVVAEGAADAWPTPDDRPISRREVPVAGAAALGLKQDEALLLRPDGHVAWRGARSASTDADAVPLAEAIDRVLALSAE